MVSDSYGIVMEYAGYLWFDHSAKIIKHEDRRELISMLI